MEQNSELVQDYLRSVLGWDAEKVQKQMERFFQHERVMKEFAKWAKTGQYGKLRVEGYTAAEIAEMAPYMSGVGVYNFLMLLLEEPELGKKYIEEGLPVY